MTYRNRAQIALNLGGLIADGFIAVEAKDGQQVKNIGSDIIKLAKALGVSEKLLSRGNSINEFAENSEWDTLQEELEATQNEVKSSMQSHADQDLVILVTLGGWIRGTQVVTSARSCKTITKRNAKVLRQPALVHFMQSKINEISPELRNEPLVKDVSEQLGGIEKLVSFPPGKAPIIEEVRKVNEAVGKMMSGNREQRSAKMKRGLLIPLSLLVLAVSGHCARRHRCRGAGAQRRPRRCRGIFKRRFQDPGRTLVWDCQTA